MKVAIRLFFSLTLFLNPQKLFSKELTLRAGELLICTIDEPKFSSATAGIGEPLICYLRKFANLDIPHFQEAATSPAVLRILGTPAVWLARAGSTSNSTG